MNHPPDYSHSATDFFNDDQFIQHVLKGDEVSGRYWEEQMEKFPQQRKAMEEARIWILLINRQEPYQSPRPAGLWARIEADIRLHERRERRFLRPLRKTARWAAAIAAATILVFAMIEITQLGRKDHTTAYGKRERVELPDGSVITLNGNSNIHYSRTWRSDKPREIWLNGEAFFEVKHVAVLNRLKGSDSFHVHVGGLDLTVLGTRFNVKNRREVTEISLLEGSLRIRRNGPNGFERIMKPGEAFLYDSTEDQLRSSAKKAAGNSAWTQDEMDLDGYTISEILEILQDTYGYEVQLNSPELASKRLTGTIPAQSADDILLVLRQVFDINIEQKGKHLTISQN
jgi:ferric-dicitrate binding protein FerR (iron transport regulator)